MASDEMQQLLEMFRQAPPAAGTVEERRADLEATTGALGPPTGTEIELIEFDDFDAEWLRGPGVDEGQALLYLHGGGFCIGSVNTHRSIAARVGAAAAMPVLVVGYRLAPEHPFPAALDDAMTAHRWLLDRGIDPGSIAVAGDSAGGGLTLSVLLRLRDEAPEHLPGAAALLSPWCDLTQTAPSMTANAESDPMLSAAELDDYARWYVGDGDRRDPLVSPRFADLSGLPPLLVQVGEPEVLLDDARAVAAAAEEAGTEVTLDVWPEMFHVWQASAGMTPEGDQAVDQIGEFLSGRLETPAAG